MKVEARLPRPVRAVTAEWAQSARSGEQVEQRGSQAR